MKTPSAPDSDEVIWECNEELRSACFPEFYKKHEGKRYCVLHYPRKEKTSEFQRVLREKLKAQDFNFVGVFFPAPVSFKGVINEPAYFTEAELVRVSQKRLLQKKDPDREIRCSKAGLSVF